MERPELEKIVDVCKKFGLHTGLLVKDISGGMINYNFKVNDGKQNYVLRLLDGKPNDPQFQRKKRLEYGVLQHLKSQNFPYKVPEHLSTKSGKKLVCSKGKFWEMYSMIDGKHPDFDVKDVPEQLIKGIAAYHNTVANYPGQQYPMTFDWIKDKITYIENHNPENNMQRLAQYNIDLIKKSYNQVKNANISSLPHIVNHGDMHSHNALFEDGNLTGIIDFGNVHWAPKAHDLAIMLKMFNNDPKALAQSYRQYGKLSPLEENAIIPMQLYKGLSLINWSYDMNGKSKQNATDIMERGISIIKKYLT